MSDTASVDDPIIVPQCTRCIKLKADCEPPLDSKPYASCTKCTEDKAKDCSLRVQKRKYVSVKRSNAKKVKTDVALEISQIQQQQIGEHLKYLKFFAPKEDGVAKALWEEHYGKLVKLLAPAQEED